MHRLVGFLAASARWFWAVGAVGVLIFAGISGAVFWNSLHLDTSRQAVEANRARSLEVIIAANAVEAAMLDRQLSLEGGRFFFEESQAARLMQVQKRIAALRKLANGNSLLMKRVDLLSRYVDEQSGRTENESIDNSNVAKVGRKPAHSDDQYLITKMKAQVRNIEAGERSRIQELRFAASNVTINYENYIYAIGLVGLLVLVLGGTAVTMSVSSTWSLRLREMERRNEERMRIAHEATGAGTWEYDPQSGALIWSSEMFRLYDRDCELGVPGEMDWSNLVHESDRELCPWLRQQGPGARSFEATFRIATPSGGWRWIVSRGFSFAHSGVLRVVGMDVDVTEQVANREELARLNELLSAQAAHDRKDRELVFEAASDLMAVLGASGRFKSANPAWQSILGWNPHELIGRRIYDLLVEDSKWDSSQSSFLTTMRAADGTEHIIDWTVSYDARGQTIAAGRNVTEQLAAQDRLREAEEALRQVQKMETVGQMTGGIAHDFNNMLTPIIGYLDLLQNRHADDAKSLRMLNLAMQSAEKARVLVSKLLSFARRQQLEYIVADAGTLVSDMSELIEKAIAGCSLETEIDLEGRHCGVRVDPNQFEMVLLNLAVNARDAMPQGGKIRIAVQRRSDGGAPLPAELKQGRYVVVSVSDSGVGMDQETLLRAVEPFYSTKGVGKGTGLGLSMAHGMAGQSGGALILESKVGEGTVASLWLPEVESAVSATEVDTPVAEATLPIRPLRILLVDDDENVRRSIASMCGELGHQVETAGSGAEALSLMMTDDSFDLLVTDYLMPSMTGVELIGRVREMHPHMPAVIASGYTDVADQGDIPGAVRLAKPFTSAKMNEVLRRVSAVSNASKNVIQFIRKAAT